jgi:glycosyltransferase involved in cell wall biosynthesis
VSRPILVMISYEIDVGFAIGRLVSAFYEMAAQLAGSTSNVHFSFGTIGGKRSAALPGGFSNLLEFNYAKHSADDIQRLTAYIQHHRIHTLFALDLRVNAPCLKAARRAGVRHVVSYWGASMSSIVWWKWPLKRLQVALTRSKPDLFIFESHAMRRQAVLGRGVAESSTAVVRTGVDANRFRPMASQVHERFGIPAHRRIIVFMGHLHERKGVAVLLHASAHMVKRDNIHFLFLGNRAGEAEAFQTIPRGNVTFGGYQDDIPGLLSGCYAGCIPSTGWDSYPMSSLEMQACGLPVIVSDLQGCPETVDTDTGIVVRAGSYVALWEAIVDLVNDPARRERMSIAARARIEQSLTTSHQVANLVRALSTPARSRWRQLIYGRALQRALMDERGWEEADERHPGLYEVELAQAHAEVNRLSNKARWFLKWRQARAEHALAQSSLRREARDLKDSNYGGLLVGQVEEERRLEQQVADLKQRI